MNRQVVLLPLVICITLFMAANTVRAQEKAHITHLRVAHDANYPPFSYLDKQDQPHGYLVEIWQAFGKANSIVIEFKLGTWQESLDMVKNGEADAHGGLFFSEERDQFLDYGPTITELSTHLYTLKTVTPEEAKTCSVGVVKGGYEEYFMRKEHPNRKLVLFDQNKAMIETAAKGKIKAFVADQPTGTYFMNILGMNHTVSMSEELYNKPMQIAVGEGKDAILEIIYSGWPKINPHEFKYIHNKWFMSDDSPPGWLFTCGAIALLILIVGLIIRMMGRQAHGLDS